MQHRIFQVQSPIHPELANILRTIQTASRDLNIDLFLIGATARDLWLVYIFGLSRSRLTRDVDFAVALPTWESFFELKNSLISNYGFTADSNPRRHHRLSLQAQIYNTIDIIPFGELQSEGNQLAWPPDFETVMNVTGYSEANDSAIQIEWELGSTVKVVSLPSLAGLKLLAWQDRRGNNSRESKDALDLYNILLSYSATSEMEDRIYDNEIETLVRLDYDMQLAGAWLLGKDLASIMSHQWLEQVQAILDNPNTLQYLVADMGLGQILLPGESEKILSLVVQFNNGINSATNSY
ncbi:nucleotidyl transferase AbiEii/AbiGii toxin family protein (plasmid) [Synechococcus elongatus PCC 11801]|uniref:Nucleotidyl transferase AbiEii/AbiGii toxin family protein n=1 Tax=Synechococcus elongatus PCC 11801 TaxID=2219813 RepID=A0ACD5A2L5_SYNEL